tara:strand:+ start:1846 stop:2595 length:750 start_codon:yes stop_codon:yes gene_type:complete
MSESKISRSKSTNDLQLLKKQYLYNFFLKKDLKKIKENGFTYYIIPSNYYLWKGIKDDIWIKNGEKMDTLSSNFFADKNVASHYGTKKGGYELQFKIFKDIKLLDISDDNNIQLIYSKLKSLTEDQLLHYSFIKNTYISEKESWKKKEKLKQKYPDFNEYFKKEQLLSVIVETIGEYIHDPLLKTFKSPKKAVRKSAEWFDNELVDIICNIFNEGDGWIYFLHNDDDFHDEIYICNASNFIRYIDYHKI